MEMQTPSKENFASRMIDCLGFRLCSCWVVAKILEVVADSFVSAEAATWVSTVVLDHHRRADRQTDICIQSLVAEIQEELLFELLVLKSRKRSFVAISFF